MDASEAREHLEMVERIVAASSRRLEAGGDFFIIWGIASAFACLTFQMILQGWWPWASLWAVGIVDLLAIVYSSVRGRYYRCNLDRFSFLQREFFNVLWLSFGMAFLVNILAFNIFQMWAQSAIWAVAEIFVLLYIGMHGNVRAIAGALVILASLAAANYAGHFVGFWLAGGILVGYTGFGIAELLARD
jgi:hypothetical protein